MAGMTPQLNQNTSDGAETQHLARQDTNDEVCVLGLIRIDHKLAEL
jgi:hypothetical protein